MKEKLKRKISNLKDIPGIYLMKDEDGEIIYVGKSFSLKKRVSSYFSPKAKDLKSSILANKIRDFEVVPVVSEAEALILENQFIKKYQPKYNVNLKDGKSFPYVKLTLEDFPSISIVREPKDDKSIYYGPFTDAQLIREMVKFIREYYPIRTCRRNVGKRLSKVCTQYHIKKCAAPCEGKISKTDYAKIVYGVKSFFEGEYKNFEKVLKKWLNEAIDRLDFEEANEIKRRLFLLEKLKNKFPVRDEKEIFSYGKKNVLEKLANILQLEKLPYLIEGFDVSNISGIFATASKVLFKSGLPDKSGYRKYKIFFEEKINDYKMIEEVLERRFSSDKDKIMPDMILIDGGKGHLGVASKFLKRKGINIPVISLSEENEEIYTLFNQNPIKLPEDSSERHLLERVRDEAHRFALSYHRKLRVKNVKESFLDGINGIGEIRKKKLMSYFSDISSMSRADLQQLKNVGLPEKVARELLLQVKKEKR